MDQHASSALPVVSRGIAVGLEHLEGLEFDSNYAHTYCRICGAIFQSELDRAICTPIDLTYKLNGQWTREKFDSLHVLRVRAMELRKGWSKRHASRHTNKEHLKLAMTGAHMTPEAANRLAAFGIIPVLDMVLRQDVAEALRLSKPVPIDDAEAF